MKFGKNWLVVIVIFVLCNCNMKAQIFEWAKSMSGYVFGRGISTDATGNSYVTGYFKGTATFGTTQITTNDYGDIFIAKYDASGNLLWVQKAGGEGFDEGKGICTDAFGNCYITGRFWGVAKFDTTRITGSGWSDIFIAKYDANGNFKWVQKAGGEIKNDEGIGISTDALGNCYVTGYFYVSATFDTIQITSYYYEDIFIAKYDANGNFQWVKNAGGAGNDRGNSISTNALGNCYVTGCFSGIATFGSTQITGNGHMDIFIAKYDANGSLKWVQKAGGIDWDRGYGISTDATGNCYVTGHFKGPATFGSMQITSNGIDDFFVAKYDPNGNFQWVQKAEGTSGNYGYGISTDATGNCFVTGIFYGIAIFGSSPITSSGYSDIFIAKYDPSGNFQWVQKAGGKGEDYGYGISTDGNGNCYVTGELRDTATFGNITLNSRGAFITKILTSSTGVDNVTEFSTNFSLAQNYPNPFNPSTLIKYQLPKSEFVTLKVYDILGNEVASLVNREQSAGSYEVTFEGSNLASGIYLYQLRAGEFVRSKKLILMK